MSDGHGYIKVFFVVTDCSCFFKYIQLKQKILVWENVLRKNTSNFVILRNTKRHFTQTDFTV